MSEQLSEAKELTGFAASWERIHKVCAELSAVKIEWLASVAEALAAGRPVTLREHVIEFHIATDLPVPQGPPEVPSDDIVRFRLKFMAEEFVETLASCFHKNMFVFWYEEFLEKINEHIDATPIKVDLPTFVDGLLDQAYVNEGTLIHFGVNGDPIMTEVHRSNMMKIGGPVRADGKRLKPDGWTPPDIAGCLIAQGWTPPRAHGG